MRASSVGRRTHSSVIALALVAGVLVTIVPAVGGASGPYFRDVFPAQQAATVDPNDPATNYWALLIGINDYAGSTRDNIGSYQDARDLRKYLLSNNWHADHIALVANRQATASMIIQSIRWLASKTNGASVVIFHYSGHEKPGRTSSDGDDEARDVALWASDNRLIYDGTLGREMSKVRAAKMWINLGVCRAGGFTDAGMVRTGRVITFSSPESELSYEDPAVHYTVAGWYLIIEAMVQGQGDANYDGRVAVEEAYRYARPRVIERTKGKQHPFISDKLSGNFYLIAPPPPPPPPPPPQAQCVLYVCY
jgi:caspase domain-containing protein